MAKRTVAGIEVEIGSGNVFADLGLRDAEKLKIKSGLAIEITRAVRKLGLTQKEAGHRMGVPQPKVSALLRGEFDNLSERKLMDCLNRLGYDIEIKVKRAAKTDRAPDPGDRVSMRRLAVRVFAQARGDRGVRLAATVGRDTASGSQVGRDFRGICAVSLRNAKT